MLGVKQLAAAEAQAHGAACLIGLQCGQSVRQQGVALLLLVQGQGAGPFLDQHGDPLGKGGQSYLGFGNQLWPAGFNGSDLTVKADAHGIELACRNPESAQELALAVIERCAGLTGSEEATLDRAMKPRIPVQQH